MVEAKIKLRRVQVARVHWMPAEAHPNKRAQNTRMELMQMYTVSYHVGGTYGYNTDRE